MASILWIVVAVAPILLIISAPPPILDWNTSMVEIPQKDLAAGKKITIRVNVPNLPPGTPDKTRFSINLNTDNMLPAYKVALHIGYQADQKSIVFNYFQGNEWKKESAVPFTWPPLYDAVEFTYEIQMTTDHFSVYSQYQLVRHDKASSDKEHVIDFNYRISLSQITHLAFHVHSGDASLVFVKTDSRTVWGKEYGPESEGHKLIGM